MLTLCIQTERTRSLQPLLRLLMHRVHYRCYYIPGSHAADNYSVTRLGEHVKL